MKLPSRNNSVIVYRDVIIGGVRIAYCEAGPSDAPAVLLLHGVPSSSRMFDGLARRLRDRYRAVALDYPGFGNSEAPSRAAFTYSFDRLADVVAQGTLRPVHAGFWRARRDAVGPRTSLEA